MQDTIQNIKRQQILLENKLIVEREKLASGINFPNDGAVVVLEAQIELYESLIGLSEVIEKLQVSTEAVRNLKINGN